MKAHEQQPARAKLKNAAAKLMREMNKPEPASDKDKIAHLRSILAAQNDVLVVFLEGQGIQI